MNVRTICFDEADHSQSEQTSITKKRGRDPVVRRFPRGLTSGSHTHTPYTPYTPYTRWMELQWEHESVVSLRFRHLHHRFFGPFLLGQFRSFFFCWFWHFLRFFVVEGLMEDPWRSWPGGFFGIAGKSGVAVLVSLCHGLIACATANWISSKHESRMSWSSHSREKRSPKKNDVFKILVENPKESPDSCKPTICCVQTQFSLNLSWFSLFLKNELYLDKWFESNCGCLENVREWISWWFFITSRL